MSPEEWKNRLAKTTLKCITWSSTVKVVDEYKGIYQLTVGVHTRKFNKKTAAQVAKAMEGYDIYVVSEGIDEELYIITFTLKTEKLLIHLKVRKKVEGIRMDIHLSRDNGESIFPHQREWLIGEHPQLVSIIADIKEKMRMWMEETGKHRLQILTGVLPLHLENSK